MEDEGLDWKANKACRLNTALNMHIRKQIRPKDFLKKLKTKTKQQNKTKNSAGKK